MSQVIIEFEDAENEKVDIKINFYPEIKANGIPTGAQQMAIDAITYLTKRNQGLENE